MASKKAKIIVWAAVSTLLAGVLVAGTIVATGPYKSLLSIVIPNGSGTPIKAEGHENEVAYTSDYKNKEDALEKSNKLNVEFAKEGIVMLKNENKALPLAEKSKISVFGKNSVNLVYGGSGSGGVTKDEYTKNIYDSLSDAGFETNPALQTFYNDSSRSGSGRDENPDMNSGGVPGFRTGETPISSYDDTVKNSYASYNDAAIIVFSRIGGEGADLPRTSVDKDGNIIEGARNKDDHYLQLDQNETDLITHVCSSGFKHVIVLLNSAAAMEVGFLTDPTYYAYNEKIDAALWMGGPGKTGIMALGQILKGKDADGNQISPSGRTCDTYAKDFKKDPTWNNFGNNRGEGDSYYVGSKEKKYYFVDYEEGIYVGYRYYETRGLGNEEWYTNNVNYPFGYGLSYTTFEYTVKNKGQLDQKTLNPDKKYEIEVEVKNTGDYASKEVVEIYATAPYKTNGIEKAYKVLVGFAKTKLIEPKGSDTVKIEVDPYSFASYDYNDKNGNGFKGYELEKGDYTLHVAKNAHEDIDSFKMTLDEDKKYDKDTTTGATVTNLFDDVDDQLGSVLSRSDWEGTWPATRTKEERTVDSSFIDVLKSEDSGRPDDTYGTSSSNSTNIPDRGVLREADPSTEETASGENTNEDDGTLKLRNLVGADYDDPRWEELINQLSFKDMVDMYSQGAFKTNALLGIGKPKSNDSDGPVGWTNFMDPTTYYKTCSYCGEALLGATWNVEIMEQMGTSVGNEALIGDSNGIPYTGWYAPAVNIHRSPFGGRNFEYFAEDGFLSGKMAAAEIKGASSKGVLTELKHFALNEQETHRSNNGVCTWATEQSIREVYLRPFEIAVKEGKTKGIMSSFNRIGSRWAGGSYALLTSLLRKEWGFNGCVICDYNDGTPYMSCRQEIYAGGNVNLASRQDYYWNDANESDPHDVYVVREATHGTLYAYANSNALNTEIVGYTTPWWIITLYCVDGAAALGIAAWGFFTFKPLKKKEEPTA